MLIVSLLFALQASAPASFSAMTPAAVCSDSIEDAVGRITGFLRAVRTYDVPELRQLANIDPSHLRVLESKDNAEICRLLRNKVLKNREPDHVTGRPWLSEIFEADGFYFVVVSRDLSRFDPHAGQQTRVIVGEHGGPTLWVFDRDFNKVTATRT